jgi:hypothetical protein
MMTKLDINGMPLATKKVEAFEDALAMLRNIKVDPAIQKMVDAAGGNLTLNDIVANPDLTEEQKTNMLRPFGYQYP